jgi:hypothetical protein
MPIPVAERSKGKNTHTAGQRGKPAACDLIRGNKSTALFLRITSQAAGRSAPLCVCFYPKSKAYGRSLAGVADSNSARDMDVLSLMCMSVVG